MAVLIFACSVGSGIVAQGPIKNIRAYSGKPMALFGLITAIPLLLLAFMARVTL